MAPRAVRTGHAGAYIVVMDQACNELCSMRYDGAWVLMDGFCNADTIRATVTRAGTVAGCAVFDVLHGQLVGMGDALCAGSLSVGNWLVFPPGTFKITAVPIVPGRGSWPFTGSELGSRPAAYRWHISAPTPGGE